MHELIKKYRYEKKFIINLNNFFLINKYIKENSLMFSKEFKSRIIQTIYFDNNNLKLCKQNLDGLNKRKKIRIRWYQDNSNLIQPFLELKIKNGNLGRKLRYKLNPIFKNYNSIELKDILKSLSESEFDRSIKENIFTYKPNLIVEYKRKYLSSRIIDCRLTIDQNIKFKKIYANFISCNSRSYNKVILELKYAANLDKKFLSGILDLPFRITKHSKYVEGIRMLY